MSQAKRLRISYDQSPSRGCMDCVEYTLDTLRECLQHENSRKKEILDYYNYISSTEGKNEKGLENPHPVTIVYIASKNMAAEFRTFVKTYKLNPKYIVANVIIGSAVKSIPARAFEYWYSLEIVSCQEPYLLKRIGKSAFNACKSLKKMSLPPSLLSIGESAFNCCASLSQITLPTNLKRIGPFSFRCCRGLRIIVIPPSVISIQFAAFCHCISLTSVVLPTPSKRLIGQGAFTGCSSLKVIHIRSTNNMEAEFRRAYNARFDQGLIILVDYVSDKNCWEPILSLHDIQTCLNSIPTNLEKMEQMDALHGSFHGLFPESASAARVHGMNLLHILAHFPFNASDTNSSNANVNVLDLIRSLLQKCPEAVRSVDRKGQTPLHHLFAYNVRRHPSMVQMLSEYCDSSVLHKDIRSKAPYWDVIKMIAMAITDSLSTVNEETGLVAFMLAGLGKKSNLTHVYNLLQMKPDILLNWN